MAFFSGNKLTTDKKETAKNVFHFGLYRKNVLVTGGNGQLGSELRRNTKDSDNRLNFIFTDVDTLDITDLGSVDNFVRDHHISYIVNCAAYTAVDKAEDDIELCYKINRDAVENLAIAADKYNAKVIHISTDYVFDGTKTEPYIETDHVNPKSVYGKSKMEGEQALLNNCPQSIIIRTAWLYSIFGSNFVKTMMRLGNELNDINVVADQTGTPTNAGDLAKAILHIIDFSESKELIPGIYHFSNMGITNWYDFTLTIHRLAKIDCKVNPITTAEYPTRAARPQYSILCKDKITKTFSLEIAEWEDSLKVCISELLSGAK